ncbi:hypothetical protein DPMN_103277 [Dreissena polymorpha]|uniref:Uncharacterized protein n=1 Tax=Dreissena polymorpha TaxID=45954 RepID=A0A9D4H9I3_DREPO|nr:hypothetical protein DPMN_103277 [Dreissena polymorpha]
MDEDFGYKQVEVGGKMFKISTEKLESGPPSRLKTLCKYPTPEVDRPSYLFKGILALYQTGELHIPEGSCPLAFLNELEFWEIDISLMADCCYNRLQSFLSEQATLKEFKHAQRRYVDQSPTKYSFATFQSLRKIRESVWGVCGYGKSTFFAKAYLVVSFLVVLLSIFVIAYGTDPLFQRSMTNCERLEYMSSKNMDGVQLVEERLRNHCESQIVPTDLPLLKKKSDDTDDGFVKLKVQDNQLRNSSQDFNNTRLLKGTSTFSHIVRIPNMKVRITTFVVLESITLAFFTIDFVLRVCSCPCLIRYFASIINIFDTVALLAAYVHMLILFIVEHEQFELDWVDVLQYMQMLRAFRLFRIVSNVRAGRVLMYTIKANNKDLFIIALFLIAGMCTFASIVFIAERNDNTRSIPQWWYWSIITMTTVGYGDITVKTAVGRFIACLCALSGVLMFALTVPLFANHFLTLYNYVGSSANKRTNGNVTITSTSGGQTSSIKNNLESIDNPVKTDGKATVSVSPV